MRHNCRQRLEVADMRSLRGRGDERGKKGRERGLLPPLAVCCRFWLWRDRRKRVRGASAAADFPDVSAFDNRFGGADELLTDSLRRAGNHPERLLLALL